MSRSIRRRGDGSVLHSPFRAAVTALFVTLMLSPSWAQDPPKLIPPLPGPEPIPEIPLQKTLETHPITRGKPGPNWIAADASPMPLDRKGIYILEFQFRPVRMIEVDLPGKGRRRVHYMYYRVVNRTGEPR